ncbi:MAG TPA: ABC transporter permease, partial [Ignavibacteriaceae bacterium]|nr:ABC transporter permease [Ignavibacteriaceae bacterium]
MLYNYIVTALRNLKRHKLYSLINISGLAVGLAVFILAVTFFSFHLSFDNFHKDPERIFLIISENNSLSGIRQRSESTFLPLANLMHQKFPEIESAATFRKYFRQIFRYREKKFYETNVLFTEPNFFKVFNFKITRGDAENALLKPNSVILTESAAHKYFGEENPLGKVLNAEFDHGTGINDLIVTAIAEDSPLNSSFKFDIITSLPNNYNENWNTGGTTFTFLKLRSTKYLSYLESKLPSFVEEYVPLYKVSKTKLLMFPLQDIHLKSMEFNSGLNVAPLIMFYLIMGIALGLLFIVSINFMVLSTSRFGNRTKEVGIRKVVGANKGQLIKQYMGESLIIAVMALPFAIVIFELLRPAFISIVGGGVELNLWGSPVIFLVIISAAVFVGFTSGIYPAFFMSSIRPTIILKNQAIIKKGGFNFRKGLVIFQFALSFVMIAFTLTSMNQLELLSKTNLGYNRENIITIPVNNDFYKRFDVMERELKENSDIS